MKRRLVLLVVLVPLGVFAQSKSEALPLPDSLVGRLKENRETKITRAEALSEVIDYCFDNHDFEQSIPYINELVVLANELKDNYYIALSKYYTGVQELENDNYIEAFAMLNDALTRAEMLRLTDRVRVLLGRIYLTKSGYFSGMNMFPECYEAIQKGLEVLGGSHTAVRFRLLNNLGVLFNEIGNYDDAIKSLKETIKGEHKTIYYGNIVSAYDGKACYDSALIYADSALLVASSLFDSLVAMHFKAIIWLRLETPDKAEQLYEECLDKTQFNRRFSYLNSLIYQNLASIYIDRGDFQKALHLAEDAILISQTLQDDNRLVDCMKVKALALYNMHDYENSIVCMLEYDSTLGVLLTHQNRDKVNETIHQRETRILEQQYELQRQASRQRQQIIIILAVVVIIVVVLVAVIIWLNRKRLASELALRNREITAKSMGKMQSNEMLNEVIEMLSKMEAHPEKNILSSAIRDLKTLVDVDTKKDFDLHFVQMHPDFYKKLLVDFPKLTQNELRLCAFIKSNLSIKEIAAINGISADSVKTARKRLRKSQNLTGEDVSLLEFLLKY